MASLRGTVTEQNLKNAFAWESQAISRYLYFAKKADAEGFDDVVAVFRSVAASKTRTRIAISNISGERAISRPVSRSAGLATTLRPRSLARHTNTPTSYPGMARTARQEGFDGIPDWFETHAKAGKSHAGRFQAALDAL